MKPDKFIRSVRETFGSYPQGSGGCWKFANILKGLFGGDIYYNNEHFITLIDHIFYDIYGEYKEGDHVKYIYEGEIKQYPLTDFLPVEEYGLKNIINSFG